MPKAYYLPRGDEGKSTWLQNFAAKLTIYAIKYGIISEEVADMQNCAVVFAGSLQYKEQLERYLKSYIEFKDLLRNAPLGSKPIEPPTPPMHMFGGPIVPGIFARCTALVARIKAHPNYSVADGYDLGIEGSEISKDVKELKPIITIRLVKGGYPEIVWKKKGMDGIEIQKEDENGNWQRLATDMSPNFIDPSPLPPKGTSVVWRYRVIYIQKDQHVGQWSEMVSITVTG